MESPVEHDLNSIASYVRGHGLNSVNVITRKNIIIIDE